LKATGVLLGSPQTIEHFEAIACSFLGISRGARAETGLLLQVRPHHLQVQAPPGVLNNNCRGSYSLPATGAAGCPAFILSASGVSAARIGLNRRLARGLKARSDRGPTPQQHVALSAGSCQGKAWRQGQRYNGHHVAAAPRNAPMTRFPASARVRMGSSGSHELLTIRVRTGVPSGACYPVAGYFYPAQTVRVAYGCRHSAPRMNSTQSATTSHSQRLALHHRGGDRQQPDSRAER